MKLVSEALIRIFSPKALYIWYIHDVYMVQAVININEHANRVLNIVKAKHGLRDKSDAINLVVAEYEENLLEPELRPEYRQRMLQIIKGKHLSRKELEHAVA